ncbi:Uncharacterised protein [Legionella beliardensis]|uniref:Uncharacterized protein n=1 Tax=Legionella beliardensis TaxID=91822 RepID=A0A378I1P3_9GAMM|nr:hypothetical protein [Legionella beliardensis]STX28556.1 Uncharacterised protein [Legionella beliardensis]
MGYDYSNTAITALTNFGPRTDIAFPLAIRTPEKLANIPCDQHTDDEILVVQKL